MRISAVDIVREAYPRMSGPLQLFVRGCAVADTASVVSVRGWLHKVRARIRNRWHSAQEPRVSMVVLYKDTHRPFLSALLEDELYSELYAAAMRLGVPRGEVAIIVDSLDWMRAINSDRRANKIPELIAEALSGIDDAKPGL